MSSVIRSLEKIELLRSMRREAKREKEVWGR